MLLTGPDQEIKTFSVRKEWVVAAAVIFLIGVAGFGLFAHERVSRGLQSVQLSRLEGENRYLRDEVHRARSSLASIEATLDELYRSEHTLRLVADLPPVDEDIRQVGVGGMAHPREMPGAVLDPLLTQDVQALLTDVDFLNRKAELQEASFNEILNALEAKANSLRHQPSIRPVGAGYISSSFGRRRDPFTGLMAMHKGIDFSTRKGTPVVATADGVVASAGRNGGYGLAVLIDHGNGMKTRYAHCNTISVKAGERVKRGQIIGAAGMTGRATAVNVHYEVLLAGKPVDPAPYLLPAGEVVD
jgi:hypothetical protein